MRKGFQFFMIKKTLIIGLAVFSSWLTAHAQLAITEVQTSENKSNTLGGGGPDWLELKNFGTNDINLTGYSWNDGSHSVQVADLPFDVANVVIHAGETIVITESNSIVGSPATFQQWWGTNLSTNVQIIVSTTPNGLSKSGKAVRLWEPGANLTAPQRSE
jgi:Lamin Tail Domain